jgi:hypothetical protein
MLLSALLLAAAVQGGQALPTARPGDVAVPVPGVVALRTPAKCAAGQPKLAYGQKTPGVRPLAKEPRSALQYAVLKKIDGCPVATPMRSAKPER